MGFLKKSLSMSVETAQARSKRPDRYYSVVTNFASRPGVAIAKGQGTQLRPWAAVTEPPATTPLNAPPGAQIPPYIAYIGRKAPGWQR